MHLGADPSLKHRLYRVWIFLLRDTVWHKIHSAAASWANPPGIYSISSRNHHHSVAETSSRVLKHPGDQDGWREYLIFQLHRAKDLWGQLFKGSLPPPHLRTGDRTCSFN